MRLNYERNLKYLFFFKLNVMWDKARKVPFKAVDFCVQLPNFLARQNIVSDCQWSENVKFWALDEI